MINLVLCAVQILAGWLAVGNESAGSLGKGVTRIVVFLFRPTLLHDENLLSSLQDQSIRTAADIVGLALKIQSNLFCRFMRGWQGSKSSATLLAGREFHDPVYIHIYIQLGREGELLHSLLL